MQQGVQAYTQYRLEDARVYLSCALNIALLRNACAKNTIFNSSHATKPAEFLVQLLINTLRFHEAISLLSDLISRLTNQQDYALPAQLSDFFEKQYKQIEEAERSHMIENKASKPLSIKTPKALNSVIH